MRPAVWDCPKVSHTTARFLLLRARSLPLVQDERFVDCLRAADELARRHGDMELVAEGVEIGRLEARSRFGMAYCEDMFDGEGRGMSREEDGGGRPPRNRGARIIPRRYGRQAISGLTIAPTATVLASPWTRCCSTSSSMTARRRSTRIWKPSYWMRSSCFPRSTRLRPRCSETFLELLREASHPGSEVPTRDELRAKNPEAVAFLEETLREHFEGPEPQESPKRKTRKA